MSVANLMARYIAFISPDAPMNEAAELMGELDLGALPVDQAGSNFDPYSGRHRNPCS